jgi:hypothetical protein
VLFTAAIYLSLSMAVKGFACGEQLLVLRPKLVLACECCDCTSTFMTDEAVFITADVVTSKPAPFPVVQRAYCPAIIQVAGAALIGVSESAQVRGNSSPVTPKQANDILLAGLCIQVRLREHVVPLTSDILVCMLPGHPRHRALPRDQAIIPWNRYP